MMARKMTEEKLQAERLRLKAMREYEDTYDACTCLCGVDEAGRGPLAGPVVAGAVILPKDCEILYLNDSKKLSEKRREELYLEIREKAVAWNVGIVSPMVIDQINILQATYEAMRQAVRGLKVMPELLLNDAVTIPDMDIAQVPIIKGDAKSVSIAAASILAKVTRDHMMTEYDGLFPEYGFAKHKGYGTAAHIAAIREYGPCPIHRTTFIGKFVEQRSGTEESEESGETGPEPEKEWGKKNKRKTGADYERLAAKYLEQKGYQILERNWKHPFGELDLIARKDRVVVYCEIKYRSSEEYGSPLEAVDTRKQTRIGRAAACHFAGYQRGEELSLRFDVIGIDKAGEITHIENAFDYPDT